MSELIDRIGICVERGKVNIASPFPNDMKGQEGADELTRQALDAGIKPDDILQTCNVGCRELASVSAGMKYLFLNFDGGQSDACCDGSS